MWKSNKDNIVTVILKVGQFLLAVSWRRSCCRTWIKLSCNGFLSETNCHCSLMLNVDQNFSEPQYQCLNWKIKILRRNFFKTEVENGKKENNWLTLSFIFLIFLLFFLSFPKAVAIVNHEIRKRRIFKLLYLYGKENRDCHKYDSNEKSQCSHCC